ncbi:hypothetical protein BpHYR1_002403 [Brachionus plicatilis]|uniref:Uncharacterized protein n=1 Tax=Brachionus plicatilis TaxID=10195 RepID=A0A3M7RA52_BRAPC|nr:hypothetical protein BpHYR1_002403 [Brachionus plicatilis]
MCLENIRFKDYRLNEFHNLRSTKSISLFKPRLLGCLMLIDLSRLGLDLRLLNKIKRKDK